MAHERLDEPVSPRDRAQHVGERPPRGHQNSSTSPLITQSAPCSLAARRAIRVTHSRCLNGPSGSRITRTTTVSLVSGQHVLGAVARRVIGDEDEVDACTEVELEVLLDDVALVAREQGHHDPHGRNPRPGQT